MTITITATITMDFYGTIDEAIAWAAEHTVFDMLDRNAEVNGPNTSGVKTAWNPSPQGLTLRRE